MFNIINDNPDALCPVHRPENGLPPSIEGNLESLTFNEYIQADFKLSFNVTERVNCRDDRIQTFTVRPDSTSSCFTNYLCFKTELKKYFRDKPIVVRKEIKRLEGGTISIRCGFANPEDAKVDDGLEVTSVSDSSAKRDTLDYIVQHLKYDTNLDCFYTKDKSKFISSGAVRASTSKEIEGYLNTNYISGRSLRRLETEEALAEKVRAYWEILEQESTPIGLVAAKSEIQDTPKRSLLEILRGD